MSDTYSEYLTPIHENIINSLESLNKPELVRTATDHGIYNVGQLGGTVESLKVSITNHITSGLCSSAHSLSSLLPGCSSTRALFRDETHDDSTPDSESVLNLRISLLSRLCPRSSQKTLRRILSINNIEYCHADGVAKLRRLLKTYITTLRKGKMHDSRLKAEVHRRDAKIKEEDSRRVRIASEWPELIPQSRKNQLLADFLKETSSQSLASFTCASCASSSLIKNRRSKLFADIDPKMFCPPPSMSQYLPPSTASIPDLHLENVILDRAGLVENSNGDVELSLCKECYQCINKGKRSLEPL